MNSPAAPPSPGPTATADAGGAATLTVALAGNPNCGKTTIFNALTGLRQRTGNYAGVTVEKKTGRCRVPGDGDGPPTWVDVVDLPGTYSLVSRSPDERVAMEVLRGLRPGTPPPDVVVAVVDASNLQRNLYLVSQLVELGRPMVVALNMVDVAERRGAPVSADKLSDALGVPVVPVVGHKRRGIIDLKRAIARAAVAREPDWSLPGPMGEAVGDVADALDRAALGGGRSRSVAERLIVGDRTAELSAVADHPTVASRLDVAADRLRRMGIDPVQADVEAHYAWIERVSDAATGVESHVPNPKSEISDFRSEVSDSPRPPAAEPATATPPLDYATPARTLTQKVDRVLVHRVWGLLAFAAVMGTLFVSLFWLADPLMGGIESAVGWLGGLAASSLPEGPVRDLFVDGIVAGVGAVVVFVPQIAILFAFLAVLEDSGYLARAAFLLDRLLARTGLHGKSFIPMLSGFACAIPGVMAARTIEGRRDRLTTIFVLPFMSCSARLPVYTLLIGAFFAAYGPWAQAGAMLALYTLGIVAAAGTAFVMNGPWRRNRGPASAFILELPSYKVPQASEVARQVWTNTSKFVTKAGTTIFVLSVILWAMTYYPRLPEARAAEVEMQQRTQLQNLYGLGDAGPPTLEQLEEEFGRRVNGENMVPPSQRVEQAVAAAQIDHSIAGRLGQWMEPAIAPLGYDWKMGVGLVGAFAAREVFVSTMAIVYSAGDAEGDPAALEGAMLADRRADGSAVWTPVVAASLLVWFVLAMQCMSTLAVVARETGGWRWPAAIMAYQTGLAYVAALVVYQVGSRLF